MAKAGRNRASVLEVRCSDADLVQLAWPIYVAITLHHRATRKKFAPPRGSGGANQFRPAVMIRVFNHFFIVGWRPKASQTVLLS
jgi:hypothetical protein